MSPVIPKQFLWCGGAYFSCLGRPLLSKCHCLGWCACSAPMFGWMATQIMSKHPHECQDRRFPSRTVLCNTLSELFTCQWFYCFSTRFFFFLSAVPNGNCVTPRFSKQFGVFFFHLVFHSVNNGFVFFCLCFFSLRFFQMQHHIPILLFFKESCLFLSGIFIY